MLSQLSAVVLPVLLVAGIGFTWAKMGRRFDSVFLTDIATNIGTPCLVAHSLMTLDIAPEAMADMGVAVLTAVAGFLVLGFVVLRVLKLSINSYLPALTFPNTGNMGLPLALFAFGQEGLALAVVYFSCTVTLQFTLGISLSAGNLSVSRLIRTPTIYAVLISIVLLLLGLELPAWIENTIGVLGDITIPMMLLTLGVSLAQLKVNRARPQPAAVLRAACRRLPDRAPGRAHLRPAAQGGGRAHHPELDAGGGVQLPVRAILRPRPCRRGGDGGDLDRALLPDPAAAGLFRPELRLP